MEAWEMEMSGDHPTRRCALTQASAPKGSLVRLVLTSEGIPVIDVIGKAPGRGVYVPADRAALERALSPKGLGRLFRGRARPLEPVEQRAVIDAAVARLQARVLELISLSRRAGQLVVGVEPVVDEVEGRQLAVVLLAEDASERGVRRLQGAISRLDEPVSLVRCASKLLLGRALGREGVSAVALRRGVFAERVSEAVEKLVRIQGSRLREGN